MPRPNPDAAHLKSLHGVGFRPVFISGPHRSGTTFLYGLLQATGRFNVVTTYHVLRYRELLANHAAGTTDRAKRELAAVLAADGTADRGIDGVPLTPDTPEEYGFIIAGGRSDSAMRVSPGNLARFTEVCRKVRAIGDPSRLLLLKNPWDAANFLYLKQQFPDARFLFIHRHPARTLASHLKAGRTLLAKRNAYVAMLYPRYGLVFRRPLALEPARQLFAGWHGQAARLLAPGLAAPLDFYLKHHAELPPADRHDVKYEDLCRRPNEAVRGVFDWLGLGSELPDLGKLVEPRAGSLPPEVERLRPRLASRLKDYYAKWGYEA
jgi:hypothetical protein